VSRKNFDFECDDMARNETLRQQLVRNASAHGTGNAAEFSVHLWRSLALQLVSVIGENGFNFLYARNLHLASECFPWLPPSDVSRPIELQFADLEARLEESDPIEAGKASVALLQSFANLLVSLIGEPVTMTILSSAWAGNVPKRETAGEEHPYE
jgi:hypothetical protein